MNHVLFICGLGLVTSPDYQYKQVILLIFFFNLKVETYKLSQLLDLWKDYFRSSTGVPNLP